MITLNGKRFALNDAELTASLFDKAGTCVGYYKRSKGSVILMDMQKERIGVINSQGVMGCATKLENGRYWYSYGEIPLVGRYESYARQVDEAATALAA